MNKENTIINKSTSAKRSIGQEFIRYTKYKYNKKKSDQLSGKPQPPLELEYDKSLTVIKLPKPEEIKIEPTILRQIIEQRRSIRNYSKQPLTIEELSYLLWSTQGVKKVFGTHATFRTVPSAGARHAFETYLLINNVKELKPGLYRFLAIEHALIKITNNKSLPEKINEACFKQDFILTSSVTFFWIAITYRMKWRYLERGYRYLYLDAGHVCQNLYLSAESTDCGVCAIAAYDDDELDKLLGLDGKEQFVIYLATVGKKKKMQ